MAYVEEIRSRIAARDYNKILILWQEYCENDTLDAEELIAILQLIKQSDFARDFGKYVEAILPLVMTVSDEDLRFEVLCHVYDIQTSNSQALYDLALELLRARFEKEALFQEKMRLVGLRTKEHFQGALSNFLLLNHMAKGNYVLHSAGWGVGKIVDSSFLREQVTVEFENLGGCKRDIAFKNAFRSLRPLPPDHFYVMRYAAPEKLAEEAKADPVAFVKHLLHDVGPLNPAGIKELVSGRVLDSVSYVKWWQSARSRMKKDGHFNIPADLKSPLSLRKEKLIPAEKLEIALKGKQDFDEILEALYSTVKDFSETVRKKEVAEKALETAQTLLKMEGVTDLERLQVYLFVDQILENDLYSTAIKELVLGSDTIVQSCIKIPIVALRKYFLQCVRAQRKDWEKLFVEALYVVDPVQIKDYILKELLAVPSPSLIGGALQHLVEHPSLYPESFVWYFQKVAAGDAPLMNTQKDLERFFEGFLVLLCTVERKRDSKDFVKKMCGILTGNRFQIVRNLLKETSFAYAQEFLLLASKCHSLSPHDQKILQSLVEVVHKGIVDESPLIDESVIWTTEKGYLQVQERIRHIGTVEVVENAKEIEAARAHGDLRENAEYKAALERRSRLQNELKQLSEQFNRARIITPGDVSLDSVGIGTKATMRKRNNEEVSYTILGQWDADPDKNILSQNSKLAQLLIGKAVGNSFEFLGEPVTVTKIESYV